MIDFKLNGKKISIASCWEDVTMNQYCEIFNLKDDVLQVVSIFTGLAWENLKTATIIGLEDILIATSFLREVPEIPGYTSSVGKYDLPVTKDGKFDIQFESLAQFEDMRAVMKRIKTVDGKYDIPDLTRSYAHFVSIYLQKLRDGKYDPQAIESMLEEVKEMPALQVISAGSFFFLKLMSLSIGTKASSRPTNQTLKKSKRVSKGSPKPSAPTARSRKRR